MNVLRFLIPYIGEFLANTWFSDMDQMMMPKTRSKTYRKAKRRGRRLGFRR
jgi:hypothetical protein